MTANKPEKPAEWEAIATRLSMVFSSEEKTVHLKGRGCKNRMELLLAKYKAEDARNLKRFANAVPKCLQHCVLFYKKEQKKAGVDPPPRLTDAQNLAFVRGSGGYRPP